jgi:hypothetical protein
MVIFTGTGEVGAPVIGIDMVGIAITVAIDGSIMVDQGMTVIVITLVGDIDLDLILDLDLTLGLDLPKFMALDLDLLKFTDLDLAKLDLGLDLPKFTDLDLAKLDLGLDPTKSMDLGRENDLIKVIRICIRINDKL